MRSRCKRVGVRGAAPHWVRLAKSVTRPPHSALSPPGRGFPWGIGFVWHFTPRRRDGRRGRGRRGWRRRGAAEILGVERGERRRFQGDADSRRCSIRRSSAVEATGEHGLAVDHHHLVVRDACGPRSTKVAMPAARHRVTPSPRWRAVILSTMTRDVRRRAGGRRRCAR